MPRFYFNFWNGVCAPDKEGLVLADLEAARAEARCGAAEVIAEQIKDGVPIKLDYCIEIEDEDGKVLSTLFFRDLIDLDG